MDEALPWALEQSHGHMPCLCLGCLDAWEIAVSHLSQARKGCSNRSKLQQVSSQSGICSGWS